jgi:hypothetical protein
LDNNEIAAKIRAELEASNAKLGADLNSILTTGALPAPQAVAAPDAAQPDLRSIATGPALPQHKIGAFRDRLSAALRVATPPSK